MMGTWCIGSRVDWCCCRCCIGEIISGGYCCCRNRICCMIPIEGSKWSVLYGEGCGEGRDRGRGGGNR